MANGDFGTVFFPTIKLAKFDGNKWLQTEEGPSDSLNIHPAAHVLHYSSTCFEGMKAFRLSSGKIGVFRIDDGIKRMQKSAAGLCLPIPNKEQLKEMILSLLDKYRDSVPKFPSSAYIRPTLIGVDPAIGKAASGSDTAILYVIISPVGDYMSTDKNLRVLLNTNDLRCAPHLGHIKAGSNYASALSIVKKAKEEYDCDQVIFAPKKNVQETAATNCILINDNKILTPALTDNFLHGITRDSVLKVGKLLGYDVVETDISSDDLLEWIKNGELALSGTAAVLASVGEVIHEGNKNIVNHGKDNKNTKKIRKYLTDLQQGLINDPYNWLTRI